MADRSINLPRLTVLASLGGFAIMVTYLTLYWDSNPPALLLSRAPDTNQIDMYAVQIRGIKFDATGKQVQTLRADEMKHYPATGETLLAMPALQTLSTQGELWDTTAPEGVLIGDQEIQLRGGVIIASQDKNTQMHTETLRYFPQRQEVSTEVAVTLTKLSDVTRAIGMRADLNRNRVELLHQVDSIHRDENTTHVQP